MGFTTTGLVHRIGIANEKAIVAFLNATPSHAFNTYFRTLYPLSARFEWKHKGGTQTKSDACLVLDDRTIEISIKNHKDGGTFDWLNTTKVDIGDLKTAVQEYKATWSDTFKEHGKTPEMVAARDELMSTWLDGMSSTDIATLLDCVYQKYPDYIIVTMCKTNQLMMFSKQDLKELFAFSDDHHFSLHSTRAKNSRQILDKTIKTNLRIRVTLNNGINALYTRGSYPCVKIQQDAVDEFIAKCSTLVSGEMPTE